MSAPPSRSCRRSSPVSRTRSRRSCPGAACEELARWASSWAKRLAFGHPRPVFQIEARAF